MTSDPDSLCSCGASPPRDGIHFPPLLLLHVLYQPHQRPLLVVDPYNTITDAGVERREGGDKQEGEGVRRGSQAGGVGRGEEE